MTVQAKFILNEASRTMCHRQKNNTKEWEQVEGIRVKLTPTTGAPFGTATPGGSLEMVIVSDYAFKEFNESPIGQAFDVTISRSSS